MSKYRPPYPSLWCPQHGTYERTGQACVDAYDPEAVAWLKSDDEMGDADE